jgi:hypothetical protein
MQVYVILFNANTENQGIHSIKVGDRDTILMFKNEDDATRFAVMLEAQDLPNPSVERMDSAEIEEFCESADYDCEIIEEDMLVIPPEVNLEKTDWQADGSHSQETVNTEDSPDYDTVRKQLERLLSGGM